MELHASTSARTHAHAAGTVNALRGVMTGPADVVGKKTSGTVSALSARDSTPAPRSARDSARRAMRCSRSATDSIAAQV
jgi:hypothetical protein